MKLAYFVLPHVGGTYSVFKHLRTGLAEYGVDLQWFGVCDSNFALPPDMLKEHDLGVLLKVPNEISERAAAKLMSSALRKGGFDGVIVNVLGDRLQTNVVRYLPDYMLRVMLVHTITPGAYAAAKSIRDYVHATIAVSDRCYTDLILRHGFPADRTYCIANAVDTVAFDNEAHHRNLSDATLRVLYLGRIEENSKGVLWLRDIMDGVPESISLTVVGDGPDLPRLRQRLATFRDRVRFTGSVPLASVPAVVAKHEVLIMPSRFEGFGLTLIEAMAGGCVPVVSHIRGVTDMMVEDGKNGILFPVGNYTAAANAIARLNEDRNLLDNMSTAARLMVSGRYSVSRMADRYHSVICAVTTVRPQLKPPLDIENWQMPSGLRSGLRTYIPRPIKNWLRVVRERI